MAVSSTNAQAANPPSTGITVPVALKGASK